VTSTTAAAATTPATTTPATTTPATTTPATTTPPTTTPATTSTPATTAAPTSAPNSGAALPVEVASTDGFVTLQLPHGWAAVDVGAADSVFDEREWTGATALDELILVRGAAATIVVVRDARYLHNPGVATMNRELAAITGVAPGIETAESPLGTPGAMSTTVADGQRFEFHTAQLDGQYLGVLATGPADDDVFGQLPDILGGIAVDASAVGPLGHAVESELAYNPDGVAPDEFLVSLLVPADWTGNADDEFRHDGPDGSWITQRAEVAPESTLDSLVAAELAGFASEWLDVEPLLESTEYNGVPYTIAWEGTPGEAVAAILMGYDGVLFHTVYLSIDDPELLVAVVESVWVSEHAGA